MPLWFLPLAKALAHEECNAVSQDFLYLFRAYAVIQSVLDGELQAREEEGEGSNRRWAIEHPDGPTWHISVFDDCGEWDYIDDIIAPDGQSLCAMFGWDYFEQHGTVYAPTTDDLANIWRWDAPPE